MENPNSPEQSNEEEIPSLTCEICTEPTTHNKKFENKKSCAHPFCIDCIAKYIDAKVEERVANVPCPALNCEKLLDPLSCRGILPGGLFERWCDLLCESAVLRHEISAAAYCPFPDCSALILNECGDENITRSKCPNCKKLVCFRCKLPWHEGFGCNETGETRDENDILFAQLVKRSKWKRCPGCKYLVELIEGCQNIKCRCGVLFCYACGKVKNACECMRRNIEVEGNMENRRIRTPPTAQPYLEPSTSRFHTSIDSLRIRTEVANLRYCDILIGYSVFIAFIATLTVAYLLVKKLLHGIWPKEEWRLASFAQY